MPTDHSADLADLTVDAAQKILRQFLCVQPASDPVLPDLDRVRQALLLVANHSDYQIFGICADTTEQAAKALKAYLPALGYEASPQVPAIAGPIYVKYNPKTGRCHSAPYDGQHRGVLVSCQAAYDGEVNETFGHLPLDLF